MVSLRLAVIAVCFVAGILAGDRLDPPAPVALGAGAAGVLALVVAWRVHSRDPPPATGQLIPRLSSPALGLILAGAGTVAFASVGMRTAAMAQARLPALAGRVIVLEGSVSSDPKPAGTGLHFILRADSVQGTPTKETVVLRAFGVSGRTPRLEFGDRLRLSARILGLDVNDAFDQRLRRSGAVARATAPGFDIQLLARSPNPILRASNHLRSRMERLARKSLGRPDAGLLLGLTIGDARFMAKEVADDFRTTGLSHLLAVSGANVAIVVAAAVLLARALRTSRRAQVAWGLAAVGFFSVVTRWEPSVLRATLMSSVALAAFFFGRRSDPLHALALAFVGLLALDPFLLWSIGFQLSFAATLGILTITPLVVGRLRRVPRPVAEALGVGIGAQAAVTPLLVFHFGRISLVAVPANLAAAPLVAPATILGLTGGVLGLVWEPLGLLAFKLAGLPTVGLRGIAQALAGLPQAVLPVPPLGAIQVVAAYAMLAGAVWWLVGRGRRGRVPVAVGLAAYLLAALAPVGASRPPKGLSLTFFDVGQGDAALVESRGGARILIDGGPERDYLAGRLSRRGVDRLDLVAFSHAHADHVNGLSAVLSRFQVRAAIHPGVMTPLMARMARLAPVASLEAAAAGSRFLIGDLAIDVLAPDRQLAAAASAAVSRELEEEAAGQGDRGAGKEGSPLNDASLVLRVGWGRGCALFTGDVEEEGQQRLLETSRAAVDCTLLKAPHHGSARLLDRFVQAVDPEWVAVSVGRNRWGHPSRTALSSFARVGAGVLRTDQVGDVVLELDEQGTIRPPSPR